jgi:hypothetical protein
VSDLREWTIPVCSECGALAADDRDYGWGPADVQSCHRPESEKCGQFKWRTAASGQLRPAEHIEMPDWEEVRVVEVRS